MSDKFEVVGVVVIASTKKSLRIELNDLPFTTFKHNAYVSIKALQEVLNGKKKTATIYMIKGREE